MKTIRYKTNLVVAMGTGNPPDVFHSWGGGWLKQFADAGQVWILPKKLIRPNMWGLR